jgi:hypothetical protein
MIVVIQCAARKLPTAGHLVSANGQPVDFVAHPEIAPRVSGRACARPDDLRDGGTPWRKVLLEYNENPGDNPLRLYPAYRLYENKTYERLVDHFGASNVHILSAGWGLIRADFLTPSYDITFSPSADPYKRRRKVDHYEDFRLPPEDTGKDIVFLGGKDYLPLFCSLTGTSGGKRTVFFNSREAPQYEGITLKRYETATRTNWRYQCAEAFLDGRVSTYEAKTT